VNPEHEDLPLSWDTTRAEPLGPPAAQVSGPVVPYQPQQAQFIPPPSPQLAPYPAQVYIQPVARKGITGPQAAILIAVLALVLPVLCCVGLAVIGMLSEGNPSMTTTP